MEKYERILELGRGSYGEVWKAMNKKTGEVVAVKKLVEEFQTFEECLNLKEVKSLVKMANHQNIITLKEIIREHKSLFLVFETILRNGNQTLMLSDLSRSRIDMWKSNTLWYRAPSYTSSIDMWAIGAIMFELYTNQPLFPGSSQADTMHMMCSVLGTPAESTWISGLDLARNMCYRFPDFPGVRFSELLPTASTDAVNLIASLLSWCPCDRPTATQALQHPFFHGYYGVPPTVQIEDTYGNILKSVPLVFRIARQRELLKESRSCATGLERVDPNENPIYKFLLNHFDIFKYFCMCDKNALSF